MAPRKYKTFSKAFKEEAVRLLEQSGRPAAEIVRELGIRRNQLYKWQERIRATGQSQVGLGPHLHSHARRLAVRGDRAGGVLPGSGRLGDGWADYERVGV
ncbi:MAG: transposase [Candidatus Methylomirabilales bacterium]